MRAFAHPTQRSNASEEKPRPITVAIFALGGEGGGVLSDWIVDAAEHAGFLAQATSVPGVAQRTGATVYYIELFPQSAAQAAGRDPVLALMPMPGDVDVVLASELMEAARAVERGFVTPDKTLLIASTHRDYAMTEKIALADGRADAQALLSGCREAARQLVAFDMAALANASGSVVSAVLLGALAGSESLPVARGAFEGAIRRAGVGVDTSVAAFRYGFEAAREPHPALFGDAGGTKAVPVQWIQAAARSFSGQTREIVAAALARLADYQDKKYAQDYLAQLARFVDIEGQFGDGSAALLDEVATQLALAMAYEDIPRVAELKTRAARFARVREEVQIEKNQILEIAEFFHPRVQEIADMLPAPAGQWLLQTHWARRLVEHLTRKGRVLKTTSISGFLLIYVLSGLKHLRRRSLRFAEESKAIATWLDLTADTARQDYALAINIARMRNLVKGYGDTLERGRAKFTKLAGLVPRLCQQDGSAARMAGLIKAAQADEDGQALDKAIAGLGEGATPFVVPAKRA